MPRQELANNYIQYNSLHVHKSNVKLHELDVHSQRIVVILTYVSLSTFSLVS